MVQEAQSPGYPVQPNPNPSRWWQWVLIYPGLFVGILGNIPNFTKIPEAVGSNGIPVFASADEREQAKYWSANAECIMKQSQSLKTNQPDNVAIDVTLCPKTGDMLVSLQDANPKDGKTVKSIRRWVKVTAPSENALANFLMPSAIAATVPDFSKQINQPDPNAIAQVTVLCQKLLGDNKILRRLQYADGQCADEVVNTLTGEVLSTKATQCSAGC